MSTQTATAPTNSVHHLFDAQFDSFKSSMKKLVERATTRPTWFGRVATKTSETIKAHPYAAAGIALGLGYFMMRIARRRQP